MLVNFLVFFGVEMEVLGDVNTEAATGASWVLLGAELFPARVTG